MYFEVGTKLWRYSIRGNSYMIQEGVVNLCGGLCRVNFKDGGPGVACPTRKDIGIVRNPGVVVWLLERDDELARKLIVEFEERTIADLEAAIARKRRILELFESNGLQED